MKSLRYLSICSGIEAATVAWRPLGMEAVAFAEIDAFPCQVLQHHYPDVVNLGDITSVDWGAYEADIVVGGTPCQSFSIAGRREGLGGVSGLVREYFRLLETIHPTWFVWENVPGAVSSNGGKDFAEILSKWNDLGYCVAWRVLDSQYFGTPQRRCRVFAVGHSSNWRNPIKVLFEPDSLRGNIKQGSKARKDDTTNAESGVGKAGWYRLVSFGEYKNSGFSSTLQARDYKYVTDIICAPVAPTISSSGPPYSRTGNQRTELDALVYDKKVRRITPLECERLQGFPDNYTNIPGATDGKRYKALGNSMAVPVMRWIGNRIIQVEGIH